ncbi:MAG: ATP-binding protein [Myxococcota bacterium]
MQLPAAASLCDDGSIPAPRHPPMNADESPALSHLRAELDWLWALLLGHKRRLEIAGILPPDDGSLSGTAILPSEVAARIRVRALREAGGSLAESDAEALAHCDAARRAILAAEQPREWLPLQRLRVAFELSDLEHLALLLALAPAFEPGISRLYGYLQNHFAMQYPTVALLTDALMHSGDAVSTHGILAEDSALVRHRLVIAEPPSPRVPPAQRAFHADPRVVRLVGGARDLDPQLASACAFDARVHASERTMVTSAGLAETWESLRLVVDRPGDIPSHDASHVPALVLIGALGSGRRRLLRDVARALGMDVLIVDLPALVADVGPLSLSLPLVLREASIHRAITVFVGWEVLHWAAAASGETGPRGSGARHRLAETLAHALRQHRSPIAMLLDGPSVAPPNLRRPTQTFEIPLPDQAASAKLWRRFLPPRLADETASPELLAQRFRVTPGQMETAVAEVLETARLKGGDAVELVSGRALARAIREQTQHRLGDTARLVRTGLGWEHLIVSRPVAIQLQEVVDRARQRRHVLEDWGLGERFGNELGLSVLFDGPPGTGKTMAAQVIARDLQLDLYQIDLSRIVSKWVGETEKNLSTVFDEAERSHAVLLFDEADSLFAKRTQVQSANDRYANLEVNYLLQRIENFSGIAILTTNFPDAIDEAFARRIGLRITFESPAPPERLRLWKTMLDLPTVPKGPMDWDALAWEYELSGGMIRNVVLRAAFTASARGTPVDMALVEQSARVEMRKHGMIVRGDIYESDGETEED